MPRPIINVCLAILQRSHWVPLHSEDGLVTLYLDQQTNNIWRFDSDDGSQTEMDVEPDVRGGDSVTFSDEDIEIAFHIANGVSNV